MGRIGLYVSWLVEPEIQLLVFVFLFVVPELVGS